MASKSPAKQKPHHERRQEQKREHGKQVRGGADEHPETSGARRQAGRRQREK